MMLVVNHEDGRCDDVLWKLKKYINHTILAAIIITKVVKILKM